MRKIVRFLCLLAAILCLSLPALAEEPTVNLLINGKPALPEVPPFILEGRTMVPLRFIGDSCGMSVDWDANLRRVTVFGQTNTLRLDIGNPLAYVNGQPVELDAPPLIREGRTMVPLRFIMENLEAQVEWDGDTRTVSLTLDIPMQQDTETLPSQTAPTESAPSPIEADMPFDKAGRISGYYFDSNSWTMLSQHYQDFDTVIHFAYKIYADGSIAAKNYNSGWSANAYPLLDSMGIEKLILITDFGDPQNGGVEGSPQMLADPARRALAIANIVNLLEQAGADGVDIDFEKLDNASRDNFSTFIRELKAALGTRILTVSLPPKRSDNETWLNKFDYQELALAADRLHIMFYDQHNGNSGPGAVATPAWIGQGLDYLLKLVPPEKLHVMLGAYGRAWREGVHVSTVHIPRVWEIIDEYNTTLSRDEVSGVPCLTYLDDNGQNMELWFEDALSLGQKAALAREYGVAGIGLWRMGIVPDDVWQSIVENFYY